MTECKSLPLHSLPATARYFEPSQELPAKVKARSPAILVMTDLRQQSAFTIEPNVSIAWALGRMKAVGVRLLFVTSSDKELLGLITSTDIQGEKPLQLQKALNLRHEEIVVRDIMTPRDDLEVLLMEDVLEACVGEVVATLREVGRHHALVLDTDPRSGNPAVRGIFSASQIGKQLGELIQPTEVAHTFAEVELALNS